MYAIIETGGKQYRVEKGDVIEVELLDGEQDGVIEFKNVLFVQDGSAAKVGKPHVDGSIVLGKLLQEVRGPKVFSFKYKRRKNFRLKKGHRQKYSQIEITEIKGA